MMRAAFGSLPHQHLTSIQRPPAAIYQRPNGRSSRQPSNIQLKETTYSPCPLRPRYLSLLPKHLSPYDGSADHLNKRSVLHVDTDPGLNNRTSCFCHSKSAKSRKSQQYLSVAATIVSCPSVLGFLNSRTHLTRLLSSRHPESPRPCSSDQERSGRLISNADGHQRVEEGQAHSAVTAELPAKNDVDNTRKGALGAAVQEGALDSRGV